MIRWLKSEESQCHQSDQCYAIGIGREESKSASPKNLDGKILDLFPWGKEWPPPEGAGNYADISAREKIASVPLTISGYNDGFITCAPVMSFKSNKFGLYDMGGNVWEWCEEWYNEEDKKTKVVRGASYTFADRLELLSSNRRNSDPEIHSDSIGFRCVLEVK